MKLSPPWRWLRRPPLPPPPPPAFVLSPEVMRLLSLSAVILVPLVLLALRLYYVYRSRRHSDRRLVTMLRARDAVFTAQEEAQSHLSFTASALAGALPKSGSFDAVLIGSGPGSLACAASLSRLGWRCCVLEQADELGGGAHVLTDGGFEFGGGLEYLGNDDEMTSLLDFVSAGRLELATIGEAWPGYGKIYDHVLVGQAEYPFCAGKAQLFAMLRHHFPSQLAEIAAFRAEFEGHLTKAHRRSTAAFFRSKLYSKLPSTVRSLLQALNGSAPAPPSPPETIDTLLRRCGIDPASELGSALLGQSPAAGSRPDRLAASSHLGLMAHLANGAVHPVGGPGALPRKINSLVCAAGGASFVRARVQRLVLNAAGACVGVVVNEGVEVRARVVVSGIGALRSYEDLVADAVANHPSESWSPGKSESVRMACGGAVRSLRRHTEPSCALVSMSVGLEWRGEPPEEGWLPHSHNTWVHPTAGLFQIWDELERAEAWKAPTPLLVGSPSAKDEAWVERHGPQKATVSVLAVCPWAWLSPWAAMSDAERQADGAYGRFRDAAKAALMADGFDRVFPRLQGAIAHVSIRTPFEAAHLAGKEGGAAFGCAPSPSRWACDELSPYTPLEGFYLTGQDGVSPGIAGALASGYLTANAVAGYGRWETLLLERDIMADLGVPPVYCHPLSARLADWWGPSASRGAMLSGWAFGRHHA